MIVGSGHTVWGDLIELQCPENQDIMCVNDIVMHYPGRVKHFYSNDHEFIPKWLAARRAQLHKQFGAVDFVHTCNQGARYNWPWPGHGTSSLGAVYTGLALGYDEIVLCGIPLDDGGHYFSPAKTNFLNEVPVKNGVMKYWQTAKDKVFEGRVTSMSGRTRDLLGSP